MKNLKAEHELSLEFLSVTEAAAIESAKTMGQGDRKHSDHVAVEAMREVMDSVPMRGRTVFWNLCVRMRTPPSGRPLT